MPSVWATFSIRLCSVYSYGSLSCRSESGILSATAILIKCLKTIDAPVLMSGKAFLLLIMLANKFIIHALCLVDSHQPSKIPEFKEHLNIYMF